LGSEPDSWLTGKGIKLSREILALEILEQLIIEDLEAFIKQLEVS